MVLRMLKINPKYLRATVKNLIKKRYFKNRKEVTRMNEHQKRVKIELFNDHFENAKRYQIPRAQLIIADIPYNIGKNAYGSRSDWYVGGDNKNGESKKANSEFFDTDNDFKIYNFFNFCTRLLKKEPKEKGEAPCMIIFCSWQQLNEITEYSKQFGFKHTQPLFFVKKSSSQVLKANMRIVGATECALVLWRDKLPKFRNGRQIGEDGKPIKGTGRMIKDWFEFERDGKDIPKIHPTQKPVNLLKQLIEIYTDEGDVVIDPVAGSCSTLRACAELKRSCYGFEIKKNFYNEAKEKMLSNVETQLF